MYGKASVKISILPYFVVKYRHAPRYIRKQENRYSLILPGLAREQAEGGTCFCQKSLLTENDARIAET
jgi:hypothetical protein